MRTLSRSTAEKIIRDIREELDSVERKKGRSARLALALSRVRDLDAKSGVESYLRRYIYVLSCLVYQSRYGELSPQKVNGLIKLGMGLARVLRIDRKASRLSFLHSHLYLTLSEIHRKQGKHWLAMTENQLSTHLVLSPPLETKQINQLSHAVRALRLGHSQVATRVLSGIEEKSMPLRSLLRSRIEQLRLLRFTTQFEAADRLDAETRHIAHLTEGEILELDWEKICRRVTLTGNPQPLLAVVLKGKSHHKKYYLYEAFLWSRAIKEREWVERFPTLRALARNRKISFSRRDPTYRFLSVLESCYEAGIPLRLRIEKMGRMLDEINELPSVECQALFLAACARWLFRMNQTVLAETVLSEYRYVSWKVSSGASEDLFGLLVDRERTQNKKILRQLKAAA